MCWVAGCSNPVDAVPDRLSPAASGFDPAGLTVVGAVPVGLCACVSRSLFGHHALIPIMPARTITAIARTSGDGRDS